MKYVFAALLLSTPAFAAPTLTTCQLPELSGSVEVSFSASTQAPNPYGVVQTKLVLNDNEIPMLRSACFYKNVPGQRGFLCAHEDSTTRYDLYPRFVRNEDGTNSGVANKVVVMKWSNEGTTTTFITEDCR